MLPFAYATLLFFNSIVPANSFIDARRLGALIIFPVEGYNSSGCKSRFSLVSPGRGRLICTPVLVNRQSLQLLHPSAASSANGKDTAPASLPSPPYLTSKLYRKRYWQLDQAGEKRGHSLGDELQEVEKYISTYNEPHEFQFSPYTWS